MKKENVYSSQLFTYRKCGEYDANVRLADLLNSIYKPRVQIIKNAELEELKELGAGTYGTVYHGRWRGSDVAIKRIKKSCFSGRASEQERLVGTFHKVNLFFK